MSRPEIPRSRLSVGWEWASRVLTVGLEFALPPLFGAWFDRWVGRGHWGVLGGVVLGFCVGMTHLLQIARAGTGEGPRVRRQ